MIPENFCGFKTAYLLPINIDWAEAIVDLIIDDVPELFKLDELLLTGWSLKATDISGCAGFILEFEIEHAPTEDECVYTENVIKAFGGNEQAQKWVDNWTQ